MMQDLRQHINAAEQAQKPPGAPLVVPASQPAATAPVPTPQLPTNHISEETRIREVANHDPDGAPRIDNEELDPELRGFFRLPGTGTLIKLGGFVKTDRKVKLGNYERLFDEARRKVRSWESTQSTEKNGDLRDCSSHLR